MTNTEQRETARKFASKWKNGGDEKQDCHPFWTGLLRNVLGVGDTEEYIQFEKPVKLPEGDGKIHTRYIDGYIPAVKALIEQKGSKHPLDEKEPQSGGEMLTPYEQAKRYNDNLPYEEKARWIVTCNFREIWIYDMNAAVPAPQKIDTVDLQTQYPILDFLVKKEVKKLSHEMEVSIKAGDIVGLLYDAFLKQYGIPEIVPKSETEDEKKRREHKLRSLNALCVRLVFCLYAEDAGIFGRRNMFHDYMEAFTVRDCRRALIELFKTLDTPLNERDEYLEDDLKAFPYVNGGLFADETIEIPPFNEEIRRLLLENASENFDWKDISPTIFGAVFESTLNPETRRAGGMHYTSIQNIHKVIDPLFLDDLKAEFAEIKKIPQPKERRSRLDAFQKKIASLTFLDPACGSGNFLTETYISLRRLENQVIQERTGGQMSFGDTFNPIQVSIQSFYGIEINDFAVTVAKTALWIAESQMLDETKAILFGFNQDFLPLKTYVNIIEGNALRIDWNNVIHKNKLNYIIGNPPFVGYAYQSSGQKEDLRALYPKNKNVDYVSGWYVKATELIQNTDIHAAFVSTNSITQGEQVCAIWKPLMQNHGLHIDFAWRTFRWDSEANIKAHVHCVIIGFSTGAEPEKKKLFSESGEKSTVSHINPYLISGQDVFIEKRTTPISNVPPMHRGSQPTDDGNFILTENEKANILSKTPEMAPYIRKYMMGKDFIQRKPRYCLWLKGAKPSILKSNPDIITRINNVAAFRKSSSKAATRKKAETPTLFDEDQQPNTDFVAIPKVSSEKRRYIPIDFMHSDTVVGDKIYIVENASFYEFGILTSNIHNAWMRAVCGRLKSDYSYSNTIVYNNFPWPNPTAVQKHQIDQTAQDILDARALYPDSSLADLYDPLTMPPELRKAHTRNDIAVMKAYGFSTKMSEADCVASLMRMYQELTDTSGKK